MKTDKKSNKQGGTKDHIRKFSNKKKLSEKTEVVAGGKDITARKGTDRPATGDNHDITERNMLEKTIRENSLFRSVFENAKDVIYLIDSDGKFVRVNPVFKQITGWDPEKWIGKSFELIVHPDDRSRAVELFQAILKDQKSSPIELSVASKSAGYSDVEVNVVLLYQDGSPIVVGFARDITERKQAEESLRKSEEKFRLIAERITEVFYLVDVRKNKTLYVSPAFELIWGMSPSEVEANPRNYMKAIHPEDLQRVKKNLEAQQRGISFDHEYRIIRPDGEMRWICDRGYPVRNSDGTVDRYVGIAQDITEAKKTERALQTSEERFKTLFEFAPDAYFLMDTDGTLIEGNESAEKLTGYTRLELAGKNFATAGLIDPVDITRTTESFLDRLRGEQVENHEYTVLRKSGEKVLVDLRTVRMNVAGQDVVLCVARDITKRKETENALKESEQFLESVVENIPHMIFVKDARDLKFVRLNRAAESIIGIPREKLLGRSDYDFFPKHEADSFVENDRRVVNEGQILDIPEETLESKTGRRILHTKKISIKDKDGTPKYLLGISEDITERREMEKKQKSLEEQLYHSQRLESLGTLAGGIAHDLNNVLAPIVLSIHALENTVKDRKALEVLSIIERSAKRGSGIVKQVLSFAQGARGEIMLVQLRFLMSEFSRILKEILPRSIRIEVNAPKDLWPIASNPTHIDQVLMNLSVNARDAMPDGGVLTVSAANVVVQKNTPDANSELKEGRYVCLKVTDTGIGIPRDIIERIFDPFFTTKEPGRGTGLGLSTVMAIVHDNGGRLTVASIPGKGSEFKIWFPAAESGLPEESAQKNVSPPRGNGELVLLVDDEAAVREIAKEALLSSGYSVITANDGIQALSNYYQNKERVQIIVSDVMMPFLGGLELIGAVRKLNPNMKIVIISGLLEEEWLVRFQLQKGIVILKKPFSAEHLLTAIDDALHGN